MKAATTSWKGILYSSVVNGWGKGPSVLVSLLFRKLAKLLGLLTGPGTGVVNTGPQHQQEPASC